LGLRERWMKRLHRQNALWRSAPAARVSLRWPVDRDGRVGTRPQFPTSSLIETTLAGGTVARGIVCAGLSEHRTRAAWIGSRIHEGMDRGAAGPENLPAELQGLYSGRKERLRANPQTTDRDTNRRCRPTRHKRRRKSSIRNHPHWPGLVGSAPQTPRDLSPGANPGEQNRNGTHTGAPSPVLAPDSALGSRLRVALPSGQVIDHSICGSGAEPLSVRAVSDIDCCR
jgi:hypothetical protein